MNALNTASVAKVVCKEAVLAKLSADIAAVKSCVNAKAELVNGVWEPVVQKLGAIFKSKIYYEDNGQEITCNRLLITELE